jgi:hypothetical protein
MKLDRMRPAALILTVTIVLAACAPAPPAPSEPVIMETTSVDGGKLVNTTPGAREIHRELDGQTSPQPAATEVSLPIQRETPLPLPPHLTIEEYALVNSPELEPLTFFPIQGSQTGALAKHYHERLKTFPDNSFFDGKDYAMRVQLGAYELVAKQQYNEAGSAGWVTVTRQGEEIYRVSTSPCGPLPIAALRGLWAYDDHWVLEITEIVQRREGNLVVIEAVSQISQDGEVLNERYGYEEMFGFQLMAGAPFYFYEQDGRIGFSYNGHAVMAGYDEIPHDGCCSAGALNPVRAMNMVAFFAQRDNIWYYVEIGVYKDVGTPDGVVTAFLRHVSEGDVSGAKRFWNPDAWNTGIQHLVAGWATGEDEFSVGAVSYAGFVAPGDYRPLEADDPRVLDALVAASIDGVQGSFALEKIGSGWLISGWIVSDEIKE